jgi:hypothetical protein
LSHHLKLTISLELYFYCFISYSIFFFMISNLIYYLHVYLLPQSNLIKIYFFLFNFITNLYFSLLINILSLPLLSSYLFLQLYEISLVLFSYYLILLMIFLFIPFLLHNLLFMLILLYIKFILYLSLYHNLYLDF